MHNDGKRNTVAIDVYHSNQHLASLPFYKQYLAIVIMTGQKE